MRNIYVDGGGNNADLLHNYLRKFAKKFDVVYAFEPNPLFFESYDKFNIMLVKKAIWIRDGKLPLYITKQKNQCGSSVFANKLTEVGVKLIPFFLNSIEVECIDFSRWLKQNILPGDNLTLKLDIEGAEYEVLRKMIDDKTIQLVKDLFVEFHWQKLQIDEKLHKDLVSQLKESGTKLHYWR